MNAAQRARVRSTQIVKPVVRSSESMRRLEESLRRLGVDEGTLDVVTGRAARRRLRSS